MGENASTANTARRRKWYGSLADSGHRCGKVQVESRVRDAVRSGSSGSQALTLPETVLRLAQAEYERQYGRSQDYERMQERGGLGVLEVVALLADYVERLGGEPTAPRDDGSFSKDNNQ